MLRAVQSVFMHFGQSLIMFSESRGDRREGGGGEGIEEKGMGDLGWESCQSREIPSDEDTYNEDNFVAEFCKLVAVLLVRSGLDGRR